MEKTSTSSDGQYPTPETLILKNPKREEIEPIIKMARTFIETSPYGGVTVDDAVLEGLCYNIAENGCLIKTEGGFLAGVLSPLFFAPDVVVAVELAWWSENGNGTELRTKFEAWAVANGAAAVQFSALNNSHAPRITAHLTDNGYTPVEVGFIKAL